MKGYFYRWSFTNWLMAEPWRWHYRTIYRTFRRREFNARTGRVYHEELSPLKAAWAALRFPHVHPPEKEPMADVLKVYVCDGCGNYYGTSSMGHLDLQANLAPPEAKDAGKLRFFRNRCPTCGSSRRLRYARLIPDEEVQAAQRKANAEITPSPPTYEPAQQTPKVYESQVSVESGRPNRSSEYPPQRQAGARGNPHLQVPKMSGVAHYFDAAGLAPADANVGTTEVGDSLRATKSNGGLVPTTTSKSEQFKQELRKSLRAKPQTLAEIAERIGKGRTVKQLCKPVGQLVREGEAVQHKGYPSQYTKK